MKNDTRDTLWPKLEKEIQSKASMKDTSFILSGKWKKYVKTQDGYKVFEVDGKWLRNNICVDFGHGEHGLVHEFIPIDEIWICSHHYHEGNSEFSKCSCKVKRSNQKVSKRFFDSTVLHEITECDEMKKGKTYWEAHQIALQAEKEAGLLSDPYDDTT